MERNRLYSLNKDLLVKLIEELGDYNRWDVTKIKDKDLTIIENRIKEEKRRRNFKNKAEKVKEELREYLIDIGEFDEEIEILLDGLQFSKEDITIRIKDEEGKEKEICIRYLEMGSFMWFNEDQLFKKFGDFSYIVEWVISIAKNKVNGFNLFFQIKEYLTDDDITYERSCLNL